MNDSSSVLSSFPNNLLAFWGKFRFAPARISPPYAAIALPRYAAIAPPLSLLPIIDARGV
jgi:hypothetical protein